MAKIFQRLGPKRRESSNGDRVYYNLLVMLLLILFITFVQAFMLSNIIVIQCSGNALFTTLAILVTRAKLS